MFRTSVKVLTLSMFDYTYFNIRKMLYLIQNMETKYIKIGISKNPTKRLTQLQTGCGEKLRLIKTFQTQNDLSAERKLHKMLWQNKKRGDWFALSEEYFELIDECRSYQ